ncbi:MAG: AI-2E family transporter [Ruminococcus sp.]|nr:AI-2E family transporter [Ruminococcus sp.]
MKLYTNKKYNTIALYAIIVIAVNVIIVTAIFKFDTILSILGKIVSVLMPVIWGFGIAYLMNPLMVSTERIYQKIFKNSKRPKLMRAVSVSVAALILLGIIVGLIAIVIPEFVNSFNNIVDNFSKLVENAQKWLEKLFRNYPKIQQFFNKQINDVGSGLIKLQPVLENIVDSASDVFSILYNFILGYIMSIYLLLGKETHIAQTKKLLFAKLKKSTADKVLRFGNDANLVFSGFLIGKLIDSLIIGIICFIGLTIIGMPYNVIISVIVGVTNIIPFFGPFIGAVPSALLVFLDDPGMVIWLLLFILVLQQFDGNILGPKILGGSTGLPAIWVMIALFIGGGLFGFIGMLLGVPTFALLYKIVRESINNKLKKKKMPTDTQYYIDNAGKLTDAHVRRTPLTPEELESISIPSCDEVNEALDV